MALDPTANTDDYVRPKNKSGMKCPFDGVPVIDKCHECELWQPLEVVVEGKPQTQWRCALVWPAVVGVIQSYKQDGTQKATEQLRNGMEDFKATVMSLLEAVTSASRMLAERRSPHELVAERESHDTPRIAGDASSGSGG